MIEPFAKGSGFLQLPLGEKENENVLFIYLFIKKKNSLVYVFFPQMRNISPKALRSCQFSNLKPSQVGMLPFHFP